MRDNRSGSVARLLREALRVPGIRHIRTRPYTPKTKGKAERFIQIGHLARAGDDIGQGVVTRLIQGQRTDNIDVAGEHGRAAEAQAIGPTGELDGTGLDIARASLDRHSRAYRLCRPRRRRAHRPDHPHRRPWNRRRRHRRPMHLLDHRQHRQPRWGYPCRLDHHLRIDHRDRPPPGRSWP